MCSPATDWHLWYDELAEPVPTHRMRTVSTFVIMQSRGRETPNAGLPILRLPRGFSADQVPAGWQVHQMTSHWYYGLRVIEEPVQLAERIGFPCTL